MKQLFFPIFILTWVIVLSAIWIVQPGDTDPTVLEYFFIVVIALLFLAGTVFAYNRIKRKRQGLPVDDELSRKITRKAAATSYYTSLILWLLLLYIFTHWEVDVKWIFFVGMAGMAIIFVLSWFIINYTGNVDENQD